MDKPPVILPKETAFKWSRDFMKLRARHYLSRQVTRVMIILFSLIFLIGIIGFFFDPRSEMHGFYWIPLLLPFPFFLFYWMEYLCLSRIHHADLNRNIVARIGVESLTIDIGEVVTTLKWQAIKRLWKFPDLFLLFTDTQRAKFVTLPVEELDDETKSFIESKVREYGGQVF
jgi:hypothetical protein